MAHKNTPHKTRNTAGAKYDLKICETSDAKPVGGVDDLDAFVQRVRFNEAALHVFVVASKDNPNNMAWAYGNYKDAGKQRIEVEEKISRIKLEQSNTIPAEDAKRQVIEMAQLFKNNLLAMAGKVAPMCEGKNASEINDILTGEIDQSLRAFASDNS